MHTGISQKIEMVAAAPQEAQGKLPPYFYARLQDTLVLPIIKGEGMGGVYFILFNVRRMNK